MSEIEQVQETKATRNRIKITKGGIFDIIEILSSGKENAAMRRKLAEWKVIAETSETFEGAVDIIDSLINSIDKIEKDIKEATEDIHREFKNSISEVKNNLF